LKANEKYLNLPKEFWAYVRTISQAVGYTKRSKTGSGEILIPTLEVIKEKFEKLDLNIRLIADENNQPTDFGKVLFSYYAHRADVLNNNFSKSLMSKEEAEKEFKRLRKLYRPKCPIPMNKQKGKKKNYAFFTGIVNMLVEANIGNSTCDYDPKRLTTITKDKLPLRTLSRRVDGAFPSIVNPIAIWEIKEYYYTTTFGSRVADGVYETLVDGMELQELESVSKIKIYHVLFIDDHNTWWMMGRSYLCRLIDMLHMGFLDEVIVGREALSRVPELAQDWKRKLDELKDQTK
jgi:hypothetical protein